MNGFLLIAAVLTWLAAVVHGIAGHQTNLKHLAFAVIPQTEKLELEASWHLLTATFIALGAALFMLATGQWAGGGTAAFAVLFGVFGAIFFGYAWRAQTLWRTPQWALLWAIAVFILLA